MKFFAAVVLFGLVAIAYCQDANTGPLTQDEILDIIKENNPALTCINWECRSNCQAAGYKAGYCDPVACNCVAPLTAA